MIKDALIGNVHIDLAHVRRARRAGGTQTIVDKHRNAAGQVELELALDGADVRCVLLVSFLRFVVIVVHLFNWPDHSTVVRGAVVLLLVAKQ